jgi:tetratricopeptide (TPR) repeat protein
MSKRAKSASRSKAPVPTPAVVSPTTDRGRRLLRAWIGLVLGVGLCGVAWLWFRGTGSPSLPQIATNQLDAVALRLIEQSMTAVRAAPRSGPAWGRLGSVLKSFDFRDEAVRCLGIAGDLDPGEPRWPYLRGVLLANISPSNALIDFHRAVALCGNEPEAPRMRLARLLAESGRTDDARRELETLLQAKPKHAPSLLSLARLEQASGGLTQAVAMSQQCTGDAQTAQAAWMLLSALHLRLGDTNAAQLASRKAAAVSSDVPFSDPFEAEILRWRGDARSLSDQAQQFLLARRLDDAAPLVARLTNEHPGFSETWLLLGRLRFLQKNPVAAEQSLRRHLELDPRSVNGVFQLGMSLMEQSRYAEAAAVFAQATQFKADFGPAFFNLGFSLAKSGQKQEAVAPFREAIRHNPEHIDSYILLADLLLQLGQREEAASLARQAETVSPTDRRLPVLRQKLGLP